MSEAAAEDDGKETAERVRGRECAEVVAVVGGSEGMVHVLSIDGGAGACSGTASVGTLSEIARVRVGETAVICHGMEPHRGVGEGGGAVMLHSNRSCVLSVKHSSLTVLRVGLLERVKEMCPLHTELMPHSVRVAPLRTL